MKTPCTIPVLRARRMLALALLAGVLVPAGRAQTVDPSQIQLGPTCITSECHADLRESEFLHGPVNLGQCAPCHEPINNRHVFQPMPALMSESCYTCHEQVAPQAHVHQPFGADCTLCHDPHGADNRLFVLGGTGAEGCNRCHDDVRSGLSQLHGPVALGECLVCHTAHQSDHAGLLAEPPAQLCQSCHVDVAGEMAGAVSVHEPLNDNCSGCHQAHGGNNDYFLVAQSTDLCNTCHADFVEQSQSFAFPHMPMTEGKGCTSCHTAHTSSQEALLKEGNMQLCLSCHNQPIQTATRTLSNIAQQVEQAEFLHGPLRQDNCIACHQAHGSDHPNILQKAFPADFYAPFKEEAYDMCFECHDRMIVENESSEITDFRNGDQNLHYLHVNREKGRSCRACHHEHASNQPKHVRSSVPFGRWVMDVKYDRTETGGGCTTGCHLPYKYDRVSAVDNATVVP